LSAAAFDTDWEHICGECLIISSNTNPLLKKTAERFIRFTPVLAWLTIFLEIGNSACGASWTTIAPMNTARVYHTATLLADGRVLVAGGQDGVVEQASCELFDPVSGTWAPTSSTMNYGRYLHTATLLADGRVLVAGGKDINGNPLATAELFDPVTATWTITGSMNTNRFDHAATLLPNGKVLVTGGRSPGGVVQASAELYDPASGTWVLTGTMKTKRYAHTLTLLGGGKALAAGGNGYGGGSAESYDIVTGIWKSVGTMAVNGRESHTATILPNGQLLVAGGYNGSSLTDSEIYNPASETWTATNGMTDAHYSHTSTLLPDGTVMITAGGYDAGLNASAEVYNPSTGVWSSTTTLNFSRFNHAATLLANGGVLVTGGWGSQGTVVLASVELYNPGFDFNVLLRPRIDTVNSPLGFGDGLSIIGFGFLGSGLKPNDAGQDSGVNPPLVQVRSLETGQTRLLTVTNWSATSLGTVSLASFPPGPALVTVSVNGISSVGSVVNVIAPVPVPTTLAAPRIVGGSLRFTFTNNPGTIFGVLATTNLSLPLNSWSKLGGVVETAPGQFQFTDTQGISKPQRFYVIRAP
jgi:hypothetical protein